MVQPPTNTIRCVPFTQAAFLEEVRAASDAPAGVQVVQAQYLARYLEALNSTTLVVESHYVDRHFIEETGLYYSKCLIQHRNSCVRIHAFAADLTLDTLTDLLAQACGDLGPVEDQLQAAYLGYVVVRPLSAVPIGRTVLRTLSEDPERHITATAKYTAHLLGLKLHVEGLAFQQQDQAVAACATTAVWSALQRVARHEGARAPTPTAITEAGAQHLIPVGRPYPSGGLTPFQMADALRRFDFPPLLFNPAGQPDTFLAAINVYVRSGIPAILALDVGGGNHHAVTIVGYRESPQAWPELTIENATIQSRNRNYERVYIHDDRLGPYARARLVNEQTQQGQVVRLHIDLPGGGHETSNVMVAIVPLYPKLRTNAVELFGNVVSLMPLFGAALGLGAVPAIEMYFDRSGSYLRSLYGMPVTPERLAAFQKTIALSRYIGVARWYSNGTPVIDTVWDTTDTTRAEKHGEYLLGAVSFDAAKNAAIDAFAPHLAAVTG